jgi:hypothetical protein
MRSLRPEQIVLLLVFVLVPLLSMFVRWLQRRLRKPTPRPPALEAREMRPPGPPPRLRATEPAAGREAARAPVPSPPPQPRPRRTAPLDGLPAVRRAIVTMTILGRCPGLDDRRQQ